MSSIRIALLGSDGSWREIAAPAPAGSKVQRVLVVPGADVLGRMIESTGSTPAQARAAALAALTPDLAAPADTSLIALGEPVGGKRLACVASSEAYARWLSAARAKNFEPDLGTPDFAFLQLPADTHFLAARCGTDVAVRSATHAFACQEELLPLMVAGRSAIETNFEQQMFDSLRLNGLRTLPAFTRPNQRRTAASQEIGWPRIAMAAAAALVLGVAAPWVHAIRLDASAAKMRREAEVVAREALPGASRIVDARAQIEEALAPWRNERLILDMAQVTLEGLAEAPGTTVSRLDADAGSGLTAAINAAGPEDLTPLRQRLAVKGYEASEQQNVAAGNRVDIALSVKPSPNAALTSGAPQ